VEEERKAGHRLVVEVEARLLLLPHIGAGAGVVAFHLRPDPCLALHLLLVLDLLHPMVRTTRIVQKMGAKTAARRSAAPHQGMSATRKTNGGHRANLCAHLELILLIHQSTKTHGLAKFLAKGPQLEIVLQMARKIAWRQSAAQRLDRSAT